MESHKDRKYPGSTSHSGVLARAPRNVAQDPVSQVLPKHFTSSSVALTLNSTWFCGYSRMLIVNIKIYKRVCSVMAKARDSQEPQGGKERRDSEGRIVTKARQGPVHIKDWAAQEGEESAVVQSFPRETLGLSVIRAKCL